MTQLILTMIRGFLFILVNVVMLTIFLEKMLKRKRSLKAWLMFSVSKIIIINMVFVILLQEQMQTNVQVQSIYLVVSTIISVLMYFLLFYTYDEEPVKAMLVATITEMLDIILCNVTIVPINLISGRATLDLYVPFRWVDILYPILIFGVAIPLSCKILRPIFNRIRNMKIKHPRIWYAVLAAYLMAAIHSNFISYKQSALEMYMIVTVLIVCILLAYVRTYHRKVLWEREFFRKQQHFAKMQYGLIESQIVKMEYSQKEIQEQMEKILLMTEQKENKTIAIENYIKELKQQSNLIIQGMYCDSWLLDSVLCYQMMAGKGKNIAMDYNLQAYQKGLISEENLAELVHYLLEVVVSDETTTRISLQIATMKGKLIIQLESDGKSLQISKRKVRKYTKGYQLSIAKRNDRGINLNIVMS